MNAMNETQNKPQRRTKAPTSFRFSSTAAKLLAALAEDTGQSQTGVIELALRDLAKARGLKVEKSATSQTTPDA